jgi:hypothetical protein
MTVVKRNQRQLEEEIRKLLDALDRGPRISLRELADRIAALTPKVPQTDSTELVREDRTRGPNEPEDQPCHTLPRS